MIELRRSAISDSRTTIMTTNAPEEALSKFDAVRFSSLEKYIFDYYDHLMTNSERAGRVLIVARRKRSRAGDDSRIDDQSLSRCREVAYEDPAIKRLLEEYPDTFAESVVHRVLRDHANEIYLYLCRNCLKLCATPRARLCLRCRLSWHHDKGHAGRWWRPSSWRIFQ